MNKITFPIKLQMKRPEVADLHQALEFLGFSIRDAEKTDQRFGASTRAAVIEFQSTHNLEATGVVDQTTAGAFNEVLAGEGAFDPGPGGGGDQPTPSPPADEPVFSVQGAVVKPDGTPLSGLVVRAYDRALCEWRLLGDAGVIAHTNDLGRYRITYDPLLLKQWGKSRADLRVDVSSATGDSVLSESPLILQARPQETVNFSIGDRAYRGPDEYTRVQRALQTLLDSHDDLSCVETSDVLILAREAGLRASLVAYYVKARRWAVEHGVRAEMFYAFMRRGESVRIDELLARPLAGLWATLQLARKNNIIGLPLDDATRTGLEQLQLSFLSTPEHPLNRMLDTTLLSEEQRKLFTQRLTAGELSGDAFWQALESDESFAGDDVEDLQQTFELQALVADNTSLTLCLRVELGVGAAREVAGFGIEQWRDTVLASESVEIPPEVLPGGTPGERRAAYAQQLYRVAEHRYPTTSLAGQMVRDPAWEKNALADLITAYPAFELRDQRVTPFLERHREALDQYSDPEAARRELLRVEQLFHLVPGQDRLRAMQPLWSAGIRSAPQLAALGRNNLRRRVGAELDTRLVDQIYRNAVQVTSVALNAYLKFAPQQGSPSLPVLQTSQVPAGDLPAEWAALFDSPDACECSHCESALSPAAYLVDSMSFLEKAVDAAGNNALDELLTRRPDLGSLRLSCDNTETPLPHIDLVNEILEAIVASADGRTLPAGAIGETTWQSDLLAAQPQYIEPAAYDILRGKVYPFDRLPFDLWNEEGRRYLRQMGIARDELMRVMPARTGVGPLQIATEALGMSGVERDLIRQPDTRIAAVARHWGVAASAALINKQLGQVATLLERANIDYDRLLRLLNTRYINAGNEVVVRFDATPCALPGAVLVDRDGVLLENLPLRVFLDRLHRFLRLQRRLACGEYELDSLIQSLGMMDFNAPSFIEKMADLQALREALKLPLPELGAWWGDLDSYAFEEALPSQYEAIFLDDALFPGTHSGTGPDLRNDVFALRADRADLEITTSTDATLSRWLAEKPDFTLRADYAGYIQSATRLSADDLLLLVKEWLPKDAASGHVALNLANLSALYRMASMTDALNIGITDALRLFALTGQTPLSMPTAVGDPSRSRQFHDRFVAIDAGGHSIQTLAYLLLHDADAAAGLAPAPEEIGAWLEAMFDSFVGIVAIENGPENATVTPELRSAVAESAAAAIKCDAALLEALLFEHRPELGTELLAHLIVAANPDAAGLPPLLADFDSVFTQLHKFALAWNGLGLDESLLAYIVDVDKGPALGWTDIAALPLVAQTSPQFGPWTRLAEAAALQTSTFTSEQSLFALMEQAAVATLAQAEDPASFVRDEFLAELAEWSAWPLEDLTYLTGADGFDLDLPAAMQDERALLDLQRVFDLIRAHAVAAEQAHAWTPAELGFGETQAIRQILSLAYTPANWLEVLGPIQDALRIQKRDALLGYLLHTLGMADSDEFYAHYLIDPDMDPCGQTSRLVSAHMALQLFVQRILFRLEPFRFEQDDAEAWRWRENYRVWEAARKVFLWPENWLMPELRDNKSQFFKEFEDALMQEEVTSESAERIYADYLTKLDRVARLEILGLYQEEWSENGVESSVLHVVGRTREVPASYFYRRLEDGLRWTPWQGIDLDLKSEHLVPVAYNGKLYLFSPEFKLTELDQPSAGTQAKNDALEKLEEIAEIQQELDAIAKRIADLPSNTASIGELSALYAQLTQLAADLETAQEDLDDLETVDPEDAVETFRYEIELGMAWVTLGSRGSSPRYLSRETLTYQCNVEPEYHHFVGWVTGGTLLRIAVSTSHTTLPDVGYFYLDDAHGELFASREATYSPQGTLSAFGSERKFQALKLVYFYGEDPRLELEVQSAGIGATSAAVISEVRRGLNLSTLTNTSITQAEKLTYHTNPRPLLMRLIDGGGQLHYLHQAGIGGKTAEPFFFSTNERCYFVRPQDSWELHSVQAPYDVIATQFGTDTARRSLTGFTQADYIGSDGPAILYGSFNGLESNALNAEVRFVEQILTPDKAPVIIAGAEVLNTSVGYGFTRFYDPYTGLFLRQASRHGVSGLLSPDKQWDEDSVNLYRQLTPNETFSFAASYEPNITWVDRPYPGQEIDFDHDSPCGWSNWELFFHIPMLIAARLMDNQRYAEARQWLHHIFDPTCDDGEGPERFWMIRPFYEAQQNGAIEELDNLLSSGSSSYESQVQAWTENPFTPDVIARMRTSAYMMNVVMKYLECLLQEADLYFSLDTREFINKAQLLYMLASEILGARPTLLPAQEQPVLTPNLLLGRFRFEWNGPVGIGPLDPLASLLTSRLPGASSMRAGSKVAVGSMSVEEGVNAPTMGAAALPAQGGTGIVDTLLLFCIPHNEKLYTYWDRVADRLFKIRHCMNLSGQVRQLALFAPPIDPALLVRASAAGLSIASVLSGLYGPRSPYRFSFLLQKALELCGEARNLGGALLAALEKKESEALSLLRSTHELALLEAIRSIKQQSIDEAEAALAGLEKSRESAVFRGEYYSALERVSRGEQTSIDQQDKARGWQTAAEVADTAASVLHIVPYTYTGMDGTPPTPQFQIGFGGPHLGAAAQAVAAGLRSRSAALAHQANKSGTTASHTRRYKEWKLQARLAKREVEQLDKQILAAEIRMQIAATDLSNHDKQRDQAAQVEAFLKMKFTSQQLHSWMVSRLSTVHFQAYQMASQLAIQAESAFQYELGPEEQSSSFIRRDNWDSLKKGLTAGDLLHQQLRQMESAYLTAHKRELEITKHVSLFQLDPLALLALRTTGVCEFHVPEVWYDLDFAGHYFRRIKSVRITIPCIVGPYTNVSATLSLTDSWTRRTVDFFDPEQPGNDSASVSQSAIATSSANQDGGVFELNFNDPRYLPFEGAGAISSWRLELPSTIRPFDYATVSDVVVHISYTARDGGQQLKTDVNDAMVSALNQLRAPAEGGTMSRLFSLRHDFPAAWAQLFSGESDMPQSCSFQLSKQEFPSSVDYAWLAENGEAVKPAPVSLNVINLLAYLSPNGVLPSYAPNIVLNQQMGGDTDMGIPAFDISNAPATLSDSSFNNENVVECALAFTGGVLQTDDWNDLYLLLDYEVVA